MPGPTSILSILPRAAVGLLIGAGYACGAVQEFTGLTSFDQLGPNTGTYLGTANITTTDVAYGVTPRYDQVLRITGGVFVTNPTDSLFGGAWCSVLNDLRPGAYRVVVRYDDASMRYFPNSILLKAADASGVAAESTTQIISMPGMRGGYREAGVDLTLAAGQPIIQLAGWGKQLAVNIDSVTAVRREPVINEDFIGYSAVTQLTPNVGSFNGKAELTTDYINGPTGGPAHDSPIVRITGGTPVNGPSGDIYGGAWFTALRDLPPGTWTITVRFFDWSQRGLTNSLLVKRATSAGIADEASTQRISLPGYILGYVERSVTVTLDAANPNVQLAGWGQGLNVRVDAVKAALVVAGNG
jgi:hypothetical protein